MGRPTGSRFGRATAFRALRVAGWNALLLCLGLAAMVLVGEAYLRLTMPFIHSSFPNVFHPEAGLIGAPGATVRRTDGAEFWTVQRVNSLGFLDREPLSPEQAAASCHVAVIGDSFVEASQVPVAAKLQVALERLAAVRLPHLNLSAQAFGRQGTGQVNQLGFYDAFARRLQPRLVVLVFVPNDLLDNFPLWIGLRRGQDPRHLPFASAQRGWDSALRLAPPDPEWWKFRLKPIAESRTGNLADALPDIFRQILDGSYFSAWLHMKIRQLWLDREALRHAKYRANVKLLRRNPEHAALLADWVPVSRRGPGGRVIGSLPDGRPPSFYALFAQDEIPLFFRTALDFTAFGFDEFKDRARRDGFSLAILATHRTASHGGSILRRLKELAKKAGIPVIDQSDYIRRQGAEPQAAAFPMDGHWNAVGHRWAAEAVLEFIEEHQEICGGSAFGAPNVPLKPARPSSGAASPAPAVADAKLQATGRRERGA